MKIWILILIKLLVPAALCAQQGGKTIAGEYYLGGVMEMASGFKLNGDSTFQFFFSYGALDRSGEGVWCLKNNRLIFNSRKHPGKDFVLKASKTVAGDFITIKIIESNPQVLSYVYCGIKKGDKLSEILNNKDGLISFPKQSADSILLIFELCPERSSTFAIPASGSNYFEFSFESWLMEVFFQDFILNLNENEIWGKHPLMEGSNFHYKKSE